MHITEAKKGIKCFIQGYGEEPDRFYIEAFGIIADTPSPNNPYVDVIIFGDGGEKKRIKINVEKLYWIDQGFAIPGYTEEKKNRRVILELPEIVEKDYLNDKFMEFFKRVIADINCDGCCGNYEKEIAEALLQAFKTSREL